MRFQLPSVLTINGSDAVGEAGLGVDVHTISAMGGRSLVAMTSLALRTGREEVVFHDLQSHLVADQIEAALFDSKPKAVKVGLVRLPETMLLVSRLIAGLPHRVMAPSIMTSEGKQLLSTEEVSAWMKHLLPLAHLLILKVREAEIMLGRTISSDEQMLQAAMELHALGAGAVLLRGGHVIDNYLTALLYDGEKHSFFTSRNTSGWQRHGVSGAMTSAIAVRYAMGDSTEQAVANAHSYVHSRIVYAVSPSKGTYTMRPADIYNNFLSLLAAHYTKAHDVVYYASMLCVSPRYLQYITDKVVGRSPKQIISDYLMQESRSMLMCTRLTIQEIAIRLGFSSQAQFARFFAKGQGIAPQAYRQSLSVSE